MNFKYILSKSLLIKTFCVLAGLLFVLNLNAQNLNKKKTLRQARKALYNEKYVDAQNLFQQLVNAEPTNDIYNFEAGLSYYFATYQQTKAIPYFEAALANSKEDTIVELLYYLSKSYQLNSEFEKSTETFKKFNHFIDNKSKFGRELQSDINQELAYNTAGTNYLAEKNNKIFVEKEKTIVKNVNIFIDNLDSGVNTIAREYAPVVHHSGDVILFTSRRNYKGNKLDKGDLLPYEDIYAAKKTENGCVLLTDKTELKKYLPENVNTRKHDASITYSSDGKTIFTYKKDAIWQSDFVNESWSPLKKLNDNINVNKFNVPSVTISSDGNTLFFVATKKDGMGGKDIYKSVKKANGEWEIPVILNSNINTRDDEDAPFLTQDEKTLYFSSTGHQTMGGYDIYKSEWINNEWTVAENIGIPFNSPADDIFFTTDNTSENGYLSSNRIEGNGDFDLYGFSTQCKNLEHIEIRGIAYDKTNQKPLSTKLTLTNTSTNTVENTTTSLITNGKFLLVAKPENNYKLTIEAEGFTAQTIAISTPKQCENFQLFSEISLEQTVNNDKTVQVATLRNSFFNSNEVNKPASFDNTSITKEVPFVKDEMDNNFNADIDLIALSRTLSPATTPNFIIVSDTIPVELLASSTLEEKPQTSNPPVVGQATEPQTPNLEPIYFEFDNSNLSNNAKKKLDKIASYLKSSEGKNLVLNITGHADGKRDLELTKKILAKRKIPFTTETAEQRSKEYNKQLSKNRAEKTASYLKNKGVKSTQLTVDYVGEDQPLLPNKNNDGSNNIENQKQNRRVTLKLTTQSVL